MSSGGWADSRTPPRSRRSWPRSRATPAVRSAAVVALVSIVKDQGDSQKREVSRDSPAGGRRRGRSAQQAIAAAGELGDREAVPALLAAVEMPQSRFEAGLALAKLSDLRALQIYLRGLTDKNADLRKASATAIGNIRGQATNVLDQLARRNELPPEVVPELRSIYALETPVTSWKVLGPFAIAAPPSSYPISRSTRPRASRAPGARRVDLAQPGRLTRRTDRPGARSFSVTTIGRPTATPSSEHRRTNRPDGRRIGRYAHGLAQRQAGLRFADRRGFATTQDSVRGDAAPGDEPDPGTLRQSRWAVAVLRRADDRGRFCLSQSARRRGLQRRDLSPLALKGQGKRDPRPQLFSDMKGLACVKCHAVGKEGGAVGPELSTVGAKYPRDELITSVLYPSAKISSGFEPTTFALIDGRVLTGIIRGETAAAVEIQDSDAKLVRIAKDQIEDAKRSDVSLMPNGLAEGLSPRDFADLIAYLETLKSPK